MEIYLLLIFLILVQGGIIFYKGYNKINITIYLFIVFIEFLIISGLRSYYIGNDTMAYVSFFNTLDSGNYEIVKDIYYEKGFTLFNILLSKLFDGEQTILFFSSLIIMILITKYIKNNSNIPWLSFYLYITLMFFFSSMNIMRQFIAIGIVLISLKFVIEKKPIKFVITILLATTFHSSAIIFSIIYILNKIPFNFKALRNSILISGFIAIIYPIILNIIISIFDRYSTYNQYLGSNKLGSILKAVVFISIFLFGIISERKNIGLNKLSNEQNLKFWLLFIGTVISVFAIKMSVLGRVDMYFTISSITFIPDIISKIKNNKMKYICLNSVMIASLIYFYVILTMRPEWYNAVPYKWCF